MQPHAARYAVTHRRCATRGKKDDGLFHESRSHDGRLHGNEDFDLHGNKDFKLHGLLGVYGRVFKDGVKTRNDGNSSHEYAASHEYASASPSPELYSSASAEKADSSAPSAQKALGRLYAEV